MTRIQIDERRRRRRLLDAAAAAAADGELLFKCRIVNFSEAGACLDLGGNAAPDRFQLIDIDAGMTFSVRVVWRRPGSAGVAFLHTRAIDAPDAPEWLAALWRSLKSDQPSTGRPAAA